MRHLGIPHSIDHFSEEFSKKYDHIIMPNNMNGVPNVFNPNFEEYLIYTIEKDSEEYLNDQWVIGLFSIMNYFGGVLILLLQLMIMVYSLM